MIKITYVMRIDDRRKNVVISNLILKHYLRTNVIIINMFTFVIINIIRTANIPYKI
jgi:hypothetical protein